jgi:hypothetical protein
MSFVHRSVDPVASGIPEGDPLHAFGTSAGYIDALKRRANRAAASHRCSHFVRGVVHCSPLLPELRLRVTMTKSGPASGPQFREGTGRGLYQLGQPDVAGLSRGDQNLPGTAI